MIFFKLWVNTRDINDGVRQTFHRDSSVAIKYFGQNYKILSMIIEKLGTWFGKGDMVN